MQTFREYTNIAFAIGGACELNIAGRARRLEDVHVKMEEDSELEVLSAVASRAAESLHEHESHLQAASALSRVLEETSTTASCQQQKSAASANSESAETVPQITEEAVAAMPDAACASDECRAYLRSRASSAPSLSSSACSTALSTVPDSNMISASLPRLPQKAATVSPSLSTSSIGTQGSQSSLSLQSTQSTLSLATERRTSPAIFTRYGDTPTQRSRREALTGRVSTDLWLARKASQEAASTLAAASGWGSKVPFPNAQADEVWQPRETQLTSR